MIETLKRWLASPAFPGEEGRSAQLALINVALLGPILLMVLFLFVLYFYRSLPRTLVIIDLSALVLTRR